MKVKIRLLGVLRDVGGSKEHIIELPENATVGEAINHLIGDDESIRSTLWDEAVNSPMPNTLIMVDGVEVKNLQGTETPLNQDQELVLLSVVHGG